jgi:SAM-dependent methyltransferase
MTPVANWEGAVAWLLAQPDRATLVRDCYYDRPATAAAARYEASDEWAAVQALLPQPAGMALDLGAGHGITSYALARAGWRVTAVEPDPSPLVGAAAITALAHAAALPIEVVRSEGERLPFADRTFGLVFARQVLHHARDLGDLCREARRVLRPGGTLVAIREHVISRAADLPRFLEQHPLHRLYGGEHAIVSSSTGRHSPMPAWRSRACSARSIRRSTMRPTRAPASGRNWSAVPPDYRARAGCSVGRSRRRRWSVSRSAC